MPKHKIWIRKHHDGEDPNGPYFVDVEAPTPDAAMERVKRTSFWTTVQGWRHFNEIVPAWIWWWLDGHEDQKQTMFVTAQELC
jgi:hypothetical protein